MKYIVWVKERGVHNWEPNGEGPLTAKQADRIVRELRHDFPDMLFKVLPAGMDPPEPKRDEP